MIVDISMIEAYNDWKAEKGVAAKDFSPQQFQIEYAKSLALERLTKVADYATKLLQEAPPQEERELLEDILAIVQGEDV